MDPSETDEGPQRFIDGDRDGCGGRRRATALVAGASLALYGSNVAIWVLFDGVSALGEPDAYLGLGLHGVVLAGIFTGVAVLRRRPLEPDRYPRIVRWYTGGLVAFLALNLALIAAFGMPDVAQNASWAVFAANIGAAGGLTVGIVEARAIDRAVRAERQAVRATTLQRQRDFLEYINRLLRHEILNDVQVVRGQVSLLEDAPVEETANGRMETIHRRLEDMTDVVEDVREVIRATSGQTAMEPVALPAVIEDRLSSVADSYDGVETDFTLEAEPVVLGDTLLPRIFDNLFENAVEHNTGASARIDVTVERDGDAVTVTVADDGPGVPEKEASSLFEHSGGSHGMGLYLVDVLAVRYDGAVELADTGPAGSTFVVELPVYDGDAADTIAPDQPEFDVSSPLLTVSDRPR